jgi:lipopolysaccharide biosynthesis glycosyltransferase
MDKISIALCTDEYSLAGLFVTVNSIIKNCSTPSRLEFYVVISENIFKHLLERYSTKLFGDVKVKIEIINEEIEGRILGYKEFCRDNLHCKNLMNFSRFFIGDIFPELHSYIYIDTDYLIVDDITKLWDSIDKHNELYAVPSEYTNERAYSLTDVGKQSLELSHRRPFNAGIYVVNAELYRKNNRTEQFVELINSPGFQRMFRFGTQPLLNYVYQDTYVYLPTQWNRIAYDKIVELGNQRPIDLVNILSEGDLVKEGISAVHFAGIPKPWLFTNQLHGGCWPSPNFIYKKYLPYKDSMCMSNKLLNVNKDILDLFISVLNDFFSVSCIFVTKDVSEVEQYIKSHLVQTQKTEPSQMYFIVMNGKIILNNTTQPDNIVAHIFTHQPNKLDGIYMISYENTNLRIVRKNLFEMDIGLFVSSDSKNNFIKLVSAYIFLELVC